MAGGCLRVCAGFALLSSLWACASPPPPRPLAFQVLTLAELTREKVKLAPAVSSLRVEIPAELQPMDPPNVVETWWVSREDEEQLRRGRSSTGYDDQVTAKITTNLGFDSERGVFSDVRGIDEAALARDPRLAGLSAGRVSRHDVGGVPVLIVEGEGAGGMRSRVAYVYTGVATNVLFLYYTAADPNGRRADEVWSRFKAALLRSGGRS